VPRRRCRACDHAEHDAIDAALKAGGSLRTVAKRFGLAPHTVFLHTHHDDTKKTPISKGETARIDKEIQRLHWAQNRAQRRKDNALALQIARELRNWHGLRLKAVAIDAARPSEQLEAISLAEALELARGLVEGALNDPEVVSWLRSLLERLPADPLGTPRP
jgi:transposase-like protein